jgi:hypothetical protein
MSITLEFIRTEILAQSYELSIHADNERLADHLTVAQVEHALLNCQILEDYPDDPRGASGLVIGLAPEGTPVHVVCGRNRSGHLILITIYVPTMPKWRDSYTRNH